MLFHPGKGVKGELNLLLADHRLEHMVLEEMVSWVIILLGLKDEFGVCQVLQVRDVRLFFRFSTGVLFKKFQDGLSSGHVLALHLPLGGLPGASLLSGLFHDEEMAIGEGLRMEKDAGAKIDPPPFGGMLHVGIGLFGIVR